MSTTKMLLEKLGSDFGFKILRQTSKKFSATEDVNLMTLWPVLGIFAFVDIIFSAHFVYLFSNLEVISLLTASLCHDLDHRGTNNAFQVNSVSVACYLLIYSSNIYIPRWKVTGKGQLDKILFTCQFYILHSTDTLVNNVAYDLGAICEFVSCAAYKPSFFSHVCRSAKFIYFFANLFILFYRLPKCETFRTESKINKQAKKLKKFASNLADSKCRLHRFLTFVSF